MPSFHHLSKDKDFISLSIAILVFFLSYFLSPYYFAGDQFFYRKAYTIMSGLSFWDARALYQTQIGVREWGHFILMWAASSLEINKDLFNSFLNAIIAAKIAQIFLEKNVSAISILALVATNFYLYVLYFAAERMKVGFLFFLYAFQHRDCLVRLPLISFLVAGTHMSLLFLMPALALNYLKKFDFRSLIGVCFLVVMSLLGIALVIYSFEYVLWKVTFYIQNSQPTTWGVASACLFFGGAIFYAKKKLDVVLVFLPLIALGLLVGSEQVTILFYAVFAWNALTYKSGLNIGFISTTIYFAVKSYIFVANIFSTGQGF